MKVVKQIWDDYVESEEYQKSTEYRCGITDEQNQILKEMLDGKKYMEVEDIIMSAVCDAEEKGFLQGFKMAMTLREECMR